MSAHLEERLLDRPKVGPNDGRPKIGPRDDRSLYGVLRVVIYSGILLATLLPWLAYRYDAARRRSASRKTCPRCRQGTLSPAKGRPTFLACRSEKCNFEFARPYRKLHRLCFPTVGVVGSGKTHWMLESYLSIRQSGLPAGLRLERLGSREEARFDLEIDLLCRRHQGPAGTAADELLLPYPLLFHFREGEAGGALLNLFDFGGEMTAARCTRAGYGSGR